MAPTVRIRVMHIIYTYRTSSNLYAPDSASLASLALQLQHTYNQFGFAANPKTIFNMDETGMLLCPRPPKLLAVVSHLGSFSLFLSAVLEASRCFCQPSWKLLAVFVSRLGSFSLFLSAALEVSRCFCQLPWKLLAVFVSRLRSFSLLSAILEASRCFCQPPWKLLAVFVSRLRSFSLLLAVLEASRCFCQPP